MIHISEMTEMTETKTISEETSHILNAMCIYNSRNAYSNRRNVNLLDSTTDESIFSIDNTFPNTLVGIPNIVLDFRRFNKLAYIESNSFMNLEHLIIVILGPKVEKFGNFTFSNCVNLTTVDLSQCTPLQGIGISAFENAIALVDITLSPSIYYIGSRAFAGCRSLQKLDLSKLNLDAIRYETFMGASSLTEIKFNPRLRVLEKCAFSGCTSLPEIDLSSCKYLRILGYGGRSIQEGAFDGVSPTCCIKRYIPRITCSFDDIQWNKPASDVCCPLSNEPFTPNTVISKLNCGHVFEESSLNDLIKRTMPELLKCPMCNCKY